MLINKRLLSLAAAAQLCVSAAQAAPFTGAGAVKIVQVSHTENGDYVQLTGVKNLGACPNYLGAEGLYLIRNDARGNRQLSLLTAAWLTGRSVSLTVDDAKPRGSGSFCYVSYLSISQ